MGVAAGGVTEDVADSHEEGVERVGGTHLLVVVAGEVGEKGAARALEIQKFVLDKLRTVWN